jgi:pyruvate ferredoxin oxidoreductase beta subunit
MSRLKTLVRNEAGIPPLRGGHALCQGCGVPMVVRTIIDSIDTPVVVVSATGCLEVASTRFPTTAWNVPWLHVAFENAAAVASGVETAYRALRGRGGLVEDEPITFLVLAGDGGTYDIGLQSLSGAFERGHRFVFVCYDNEAYMNTGVQRSGATPFGAGTTTSPAGRAALGKAEQRKDMTAIAVAHHIPYVAQACSVHWQDLSEKVERGAKADGPAFLNVLTDCPVGWGHEPRESLDVLNAAVDSCFWPLYEVVDGRYRLTYEPEQIRPVEDWLRPQARFAHLLRPEASESVKEIQRRIDEDWAVLRRRSEQDSLVH